MWLAVILHIFSDLIFLVKFVVQVLFMHYHDQTEILGYTMFFWKHFQLLSLLYNDIFHQSMR